MVRNNKIIAALFIFLVIFSVSFYWQSQNTHTFHPDSISYELKGVDLYKKMKGNFLSGALTFSTYKLWKSNIMPQFFALPLLLTSGDRILSKKILLSTIYAISCVLTFLFFLGLKNSIYLAIPPTLLGMFSYSAFLLFTTYMTEPILLCLIISLAFCLYKSSFLENSLLTRLSLVPLAALILLRPLLSITFIFFPIIFFFYYSLRIKRNTISGKTLTLAGFTIIGSYLWHLIDIDKTSGWPFVAIFGDFAHRTGRDTSFDSFKYLISALKDSNYILHIFLIMTISILGIKNKLKKKNLIHFILIILCYLFPYLLASLTPVGEHRFFIPLNTLFTLCLLAIIIKQTKISKKITITISSLFLVISIYSAKDLFINYQSDHSLQEAKLFLDTLEQETQFQKYGKKIGIIRMQTENMAPHPFLFRAISYDNSSPLLINRFYINSSATNSPVIKTINKLKNRFNYILLGPIDGKIEETWEPELTSFGSSLLEKYKKNNLMEFSPKIIFLKNWGQYLLLNISN